MAYMAMGREQATSRPGCRARPQPLGQSIASPPTQKSGRRLTWQISNVVADAADNNPCSLYFLNILIDTTVGVLIFYLTLKGLTWYLTERLGKEGFVSGQYGTPPKPIL